jgi:hypothetical protein
VLVVVVDEWARRAMRIEGSGTHAQTETVGRIWHVKSKFGHAKSACENLPDLIISRWTTETKSPQFTCNKKSTPLLSHEDLLVLTICEKRKKIFILSMLSRPLQSTLANFLNAGYFKWG